MYIVQHLTRLLLRTTKFMNEAANQDIDGISTTGSYV